MSDFNTWSISILWRLLEVTAGASLCFLLILAVQRALGQQLRANWRYALWGVLLVRMLLPINYEASLFTLLTIPRNEPAPIAGPALAPPADTIDAIAEISGPVDLAPSTPSVQITAPAKTLPTTAPSPSKPRELPIAAALFTLWLAGALAVIARVLARHIRLSRMIERNALPAPESVSHVLRRVRDELSIAIWPAALVTSAIATPTVVGAFRPRVLLPKDLAETASAEELRLILMHELVHIQRRDLFVAWLWLLALALHWFNPLMWVAGVLMRRDREKACDQRVLAALPDQERIAYGHTLLKAVASVDPKSGFNHYAGTAAIVENEAELEERLTMVRNYRPSRALHRILGALTAIVIIGLAFTQFWAVGQESPKTPAASVPKSAATKPEKAPNPFADISDDDQLEVLSNQAIAQGDFFRACDAQLRRVDVALERGRPTNDFGLTEVYSDLKKGNPSLTDAAKRGLLDEAEEYAAAHPMPEHQWRIRELQFDIASNIGDYDRAAAYLDQALPLLPGISDNSPRIRNPFHEMVADRFALIWRKDGQEVAEDYIVTLWKSDPRFNPQFPDYFRSLSYVYRNAGIDLTTDAQWSLINRLGEKPAIPLAQAGSPQADAFRTITDEAELIRLRDEAAKAGDIVRACEAEMRRVKLRGEQGNADKDKIDFSAVHTALPRPKTIKEGSMHAEVLNAYLAQHIDDPDYGWRINHLLSMIAADILEATPRRQALERALRTYPPVAYPDPSKHSKFQQLANEEAMLIWDTEGVEAAEKFVIDLWKKDPRFAYFYTQPWEERYAKEQFPADRLAKLQAAMGEKTPLTEVKVLLTPDGLWYVEKPATMEEIATYLEQIPFRFNYFVSLGYTDDNISIKTWQDAKNQLLRLVQKLGFDHFSDIGKQPADAAVKTDIGTYIEIELPFFIAADGTYILNGKTVADDALKETLSSAPPDAHLILRVDPSAPSGRAQNVLAAAKEAGIKNVSIDEPDATKENAPQK